MNIYRKMTGLALGLLLLNACYDDQGNYDYHPINDVVIADTGFVDTTYSVTSFVDTLRIKPVIESSIEKDLSKYEFEWFVKGNNDTKIQMVIGNTLNLNYPVELPTQLYTVFFRMKDISTGIIYTQTTTLNVSDIFSFGWLVLGENDGGYAQLDMITLDPYGSTDTLILKNITENKGFPQLKGPKFIYQIYYRGDYQIYCSTEDGAYWLYRDDYSCGTECHFSSLFFDPTVTDKFVVTDMYQTMRYCRYAIVDGKAFVVFSFNEEGGDRFGAASNRYKGKYNYFRIGDKIGANPKKSTKKVVYYNLDEKRFVSQNPGDSYCDSINDTQDDKKVFSWKTGLDYVTTVNSCHTTNGNTYTILKDNNGKYYLYGYRIDDRYGVIKIGKWELTGAQNIAQAKFFGHSNANTYLFYTVGSQLYGYDYGRQIEYPLKDFNNEITLYWHHVQNSLYGTGASGDNFYIATYDPSKPKSISGTLMGFKVLNDVNKISIEPMEGASWDGLCKVSSISYRQY